MSIISDVVSYYENNAICCAAIPFSSVFLSTVPEVYTFPYVIFNIISTTGQYTTGSPWLANLTFQISVYDLNADNCESNAEIIWGQYSFIQINATTAGVVPQGSPILLPITVGPEQTWCASSTFSIRENRSLPNT